MNIKIDVKDKKILNELDKDVQITSKQLGKKCNLSPQVVEYRIRKLLTQGTIYKFYTLIDVSKLGLISFRVHIKLKNVSEEQYSNFAKNLFHNYPTFWVGFVSGNFDIIADIFAKNNTEFEIMFAKILEKHKDIIRSYEIMPILEMDLYEYGYLTNKPNTRTRTIMHRIGENTEIDDVDIKILNAIKFDARMPYEKIGQEVKLTRNAVKYRIKNLEKIGVIAGYKLFIDYRHFDKNSWKIFLKYNNSKIEQENLLMECLKEKEGILATTKHLGRWNLDIEIQIKDARELQKFLIMLRNKFNIIEHYEIVQLLEDYGIDFFPSKLNN